MMSTTSPFLLKDGRMPQASATNPFDWLDEHAEQRRREGLTRTLRPGATDEPCVNLAGNDYLGLTHHPRVTKAAANAALRFGAGSIGSRLVTGTTRLHQQLEAELAAPSGAEAALVFTSGTRPTSPPSPRPPPAGCFRLRPEQPCLAHRRLQAVRGQSRRGETRGHGGVRERARRP